MFKYTFMEVSPCISKVWKQLSLIIRIREKLKRKTKMDDIKQKACYNPNFKH